MGDHYPRLTATTPILAQPIWLELAAHRLPTAVGHAGTTVSRRGCARMRKRVRGHPPQPLRGYMSRKVIGHVCFVLAAAYAAAITLLVAFLLVRVVW